MSNVRTNWAWITYLMVGSQSNRAQASPRAYRNGTAVVANIYKKKIIIRVFIVIFIHCLGFVCACQLPIAVLVDWAKRRRKYKIQHILNTNWNLIWTCVVCVMFVFPPNVLRRSVGRSLSSKFIITIDNHRGSSARANPLDTHEWRTTDGQPTECSQ